MVDDTRLELVTSHTSSGCATSCANRQFSCQLAYITRKPLPCQALFSFFRLPPAAARGKMVDIIIKITLLLQKIVTALFQIILFFGDFI